MACLAAGFPSNMSRQEGEAVCVNQSVRLQKTPVRDVTTIGGELPLLWLLWVTSTATNWLWVKLPLAI